MVEGRGALAAEWTLCTTAFLIYCLRLYVRRYVSKVGFQREDLLLGIAQALFFCWISIDAYTISRHFMDGDRSYLDDFVDELPLQDSEKIHVLKAIYASSVPYYLCVWFVKFAMIGLYFRIVPSSAKKSYYFLWTTLVCTVVSIVAVILINLLLCQPVSLNWSLVWDNHCYSSTAVTPFAISVVFNIVTDIMIFIVPFPVLRTLKTLNRKQRIGLIATFSLGAITIVVCVARVVLLALTGLIALTAVLTAVECFTFLTVASMPAMRVLLKKRPFRNSKKSMSDDESEHYTSAQAAYRPSSMPAPVNGNFDASGSGMVIDPHSEDEKMRYMDSDAPVSPGYPPAYNSALGGDRPDVDPKQYIQPGSAASDYPDYVGDEEGVQLVNLPHNLHNYGQSSRPESPGGIYTGYDGGYPRGVPGSNVPIPIGNVGTISNGNSEPIIMGNNLASGGSGFNMGSVYGEESLPPVPGSSGHNHSHGQDEEQRDPFAPDYLYQAPPNPTI
uniref:ARAD1D03608p n=1 Tax=Blastobotrys adeninivorans TaxID=409370 RepID=A0A060TD14_BLAAD